MLGMGVHLGQNCANPVVLDTEFLDPLLVIGSGLIGYGHILELSFLGEVDIIKLAGVRRLSTIIRNQLALPIGCGISRRVELRGWEGLIGLP